MRVFGAAVAVIALLLVVVAPAGAQTALSAERFAAIDAVLEKSVALEQEFTEAAFEEVRVACRALASADPLLGPQRKACTASARFARSYLAYRTCESRASCLRRARRARGDVTTFIRLIRAANDALSAAMLVDACDGALCAGRADLQFFARARDLLALAERAGTTRSSTLARRVRRDTRAIDVLAAKRPTAARERERFRAACGPAPA